METEEGRRWAEAKLKQLSGGDPIKARFMRQDFFEYVPQFKLLFAGNHKPSLRGVDKAMRRRLHLIPFTVTIPAEERDTGLFDKLRAEWPAILRWMVAGCLAWQCGGLGRPASVAAATEDYLAAEDIVAQWLAEHCQRESGAWTATRDLYASFKLYAEGAGERPPTRSGSCRRWRIAATGAIGMKRGAGALSACAWGACRDGGEAAHRHLL